MSKRKADEQSVQDDERAAELTLQIESLNEQLLRERADAMNVRRRAEEEKLKLGSFYKALVLKELLPVIDSFERATAVAHQSGEQGTSSNGDPQKGFDTIYKQFLQVLDKLGVERIKTVGEHFDPNTMEAVTMEEGDSEHEIVAEELQSGYKMGDDLIRPAMVRVRG